MPAEAASVALPPDGKGKVGRRRERAEEEEEVMAHHGHLIIFVII